MGYTHEEQALARELKAKLKKINSELSRLGDRVKARNEAETREAIRVKHEATMAELRMKKARTDFAVGLEVLARDLASTANVYKMQLMDPIQVRKDSDTAVITIKVQRMP